MPDIFIALRNKNKKATCNSLMYLKAYLYPVYVRELGGLAPTNIMDAQALLAEHSMRGSRKLFFE